MGWSLLLLTKTYTLDCLVKLIHISSYQMLAELFMARTFPFFSLSSTLHFCFRRDLQLQNLDVIVADICTFDMDATYDRIFSIEMFEVSKCATLSMP